MRGRSAGRPRWSRLQALLKPGLPGLSPVFGLFTDRGLFPAGKQVKAEEVGLVESRRQLSVLHKLSAQAAAGLVGTASWGLCSHRERAWLCTRRRETPPGICRDPHASSYAERGRPAAHLPSGGRRGGHRTQGPQSGSPRGTGRPLSAKQCSPWRICKCYANMLNRMQGKEVMKHFL